jgi:hypothetical protein
MACALEQTSRWLADHSLAVQAVAAAVGILLTAVLVATTIFYAHTTTKILEESRKTREAAERQATASQENLQLLKRQLEAQLGLGPQVLRESILDAKRLIVYWLERAAHIAYPPHGNPDPAVLVTSALVGAADHARKISDECVQLILEAHDALRNAKSEFERAYQTARHQTLALGGIGPTVYLHSANIALDKALAIVSQHLQGASQAGQ